MEIANPDEAKAVWETEYRNSLLDRAMTVMKDHFQPQTWKACWELLTTEKSRRSGSGVRDQCWSSLCSESPRAGSSA